MKKNKQEKGITLIALIITIVILLILAVVTVASIQNDEMLGHAADAGSAYNKAQKDEVETLGQHKETLNKYTPSQEEAATVKNITKNIIYSTIKEAIDNAENNDIIEIAEGEYDLVGESDLLNQTNILEISKSITLRAANANKKPTLLLASSDGTTIAKIIEGLEIKADNVRLENIILKVAAGKTGSGNLVKIPAKSTSSTDFYQGITIEGCELYGADHSIEMYVENANIKNCIFDESTAADQGNIMVVKATKGTLNIINNTFKGYSQKKHGISFYAGNNSHVQGNILIENNTFNQVYKCIVHESTMTYENVSVKIKNNTFTNYKKKAVAVDKGSFIEYVISGNVFDIPSDGTVIIDNGTDFMLDANNNYWGTNNPVKAEIFEGNVNATTYYTTADKSNNTSWN